MYLQNILDALGEIRESIIWNDVVDADFEDSNREHIIFAIDDIISRVQNPQDEDF